MGAWGFNITENDSALDLIDEVLEITDNASLARCVITNSAPKNVISIFNNNRNQIFQLASGIFDEHSHSYIGNDTLVYGLYLIVLNIKPTQTEIDAITKAISMEKESLSDWTEEESRFQVILNFEEKFKLLCNV